jgi:hypothetical protein
VPRPHGFIGNFYKHTYDSLYRSTFIIILYYYLSPRITLAHNTHVLNFFFFPKLDLKQAIIIKQNSKAPLAEPIGSGQGERLIRGARSYTDNV